MSTGEPWKPERMEGLYAVCRTIVRAIFRTYFRWKVLHAARVPAVGPAILAANHVSFGDPPLIGCAVERPVHSLARSSLFEKPVLSWLIPKLNAVPVDRDGGGGAGLKVILERLHRGCAIVLFPEGTRSPDGAIHRARAGIGLIVIKSDAPVVPVRLLGMYEAWGRHRIIPRPRQVTVVFGEPLDFAALRAEAKVCDKARLKEIYQIVSDEVMAAIGRVTRDE